MAKKIEKEKSAIEKIGEFHRFGSVLGLTRMNELMKRLGNPEKELKCIHVAGTNGKGSVCRFIYSALRANGYSTGIYTSPYLTVFNERIELDGEYISDDDLETYTEEVLAKVSEMTADGLDSPTEFEVITAVAFLYFARKGCDYAVMEVGLGGRGDSTNIIEKPLVSVITSISYDHTDRLGNTLAEIAREKAGIIKPGAPVVMNVDTEEAAKEIARTAYKNGCVLHDVSGIKCVNVENDITGSTFDAFIGETDYNDMKISMLGKHQIENALTALTALEVLRRKRDIKVERSRLYKGFEEAKNIGRFEIMPASVWQTSEAEGRFESTEVTEAEGRLPAVILDGAHNEAGAAALAETLKTYFPGSRILAVTGVLSDKAADKITESLCGVCESFIATEPGNERKLDAALLADMIEKKGKPCLIKKKPAEAMKTALEKGKKEGFDAVLFAGSLYLIGELRGILLKGRDEK